MYYASHGEAQDRVDELIASEARVIEMWRFKMPKHKAAMIAALNDAAGVETKLWGTQENLVGLQRDDAERECEDCQDESPPNG